MAQQDNEQYLARAKGYLDDLHGGNDPLKTAEIAARVAQAEQTGRLASAIENLVDRIGEHDEQARWARIDDQLERSSSVDPLVQKEYDRRHSMGLRPDASTYTGDSSGQRPPGFNPDLPQGGQH